MVRILWTQKQDAGPSARRASAMAYDSSRGRTVLFGGFSPTVDAFADTWEWDGENWTQMADSGPPARGGGAMAYDVQRNQTVLFGGAGPVALLVDTWGWDGSTWTQLAVSGPSPRTNFAMIYDSKRKRIVVFGGLLGGYRGGPLGGHLGVGRCGMDSIGGDWASRTPRSRDGVRQHSRSVRPFRRFEPLAPDAWGYLGVERFNVDAGQRFRHRTVCVCFARLQGRQRRAVRWYKRNGIRSCS